MKIQLIGLCTMLALGCREEAHETQPAPSSSTAAEPTSRDVRPLDPNNIVSIASNSKDHTTLVSALKAADYVESVASSGPFTVFAPTNDAFAKLPKETLDGLMKPEKKDQLRDVLKYHVTVPALAAKDLHDGMVLAMADGKKATVHVKDGKITINGANVIASIPASNGVIHVIDTVLLPPS